MKILSLFCLFPVLMYATEICQDFKNEVNVQIYLLEKQINHFASEENYNPDFWYAKGKLDAYLGIQKEMNQNSICD